ncbi:hypothetical protein [Tepidimonas alkaliphilus]|uniref:hypothetical protein n=1 Tax=Tepidimonas alkaliphilus TaxID=2588942 RepID=UPI00117CDD5A|nr:hypothetical protein [Tepidimonas alkaliphilus]
MESLKGVARLGEHSFNIPVRFYHRDVESITLPVNPVAARTRCAEGQLLLYAEALDCVTSKRFVRAPHRVLFLAVQHGHWWAYLPPASCRYLPRRPGIRLLVFVCRPLGWSMYRLDRARLTERLRDALMACELKFW